MTRDRISAEAEWRGRPFTLVDTGGIGLLRGEKADDVITRAALEQVELAIEAANVIILVVNVQEGIVPLDREVAERLRRSGKPVLVAVNKVDTEKVEPAPLEFCRARLREHLPGDAPSTVEGIEELADGCAVAIPGLHRTAGSSRRPGERARQPRPSLKLAIVGRPNVGKSSIINALTQSERVIVSPIPGTTRDAVDVPFEVETDGVRQSIF